MRYGNAFCPIIILSAMLAVAGCTSLGDLSGNEFADVISNMQQGPSADQSTSNDTTPPRVVIQSPKSGDKLSDVFEVSGSAIDESGIRNFIVFNVSTATGATNFDVLALNGTGLVNFYVNVHVPFFGYYFIWAMIEDNAGNVSKTPVILVDITNGASFEGDRTPPDLSINTPAEGSTNGFSVFVSGTASDPDSGVEGVYISTNNIDFGRAALDGYGNWYSNLTMTNGVQVIYFFARDNSNNFTSTNYRAIVVDTTGTINLFRGSTPVSPGTGYTNDVGTAMTNTQTSPVVFTISNSGNASLFVGSVSCGSPGFQVSVFSNVTISPGSSAVFNVTCTPQALGDTVGTVTINSSDPANGSFSFIIKATGTGQLLPAIDIYKGSQELPDSSQFTNDFGSLVTNSNSSVVNFTISNTGSTNLRVYSITSSLADFVATALSNVDVAAGGAAGFAVYFCPSIIGNRSAVITVNSTDPNRSNFTFVATGTGIVPSIPALAVYHAGAAISQQFTNDYGSVLTNTAGSNETFIVSNAGTGDLTITSVSDNSGHYSTSALSVTLTPGQTTNFTVTFAPTAVGTQTGAVTIANNDPVNGSFTFTVTGTGIGTGIVEVPVITCVRTSGNSNTYQPEGTTVTMTCGTGGATIYWTTNGVDPTTGDASYSGTIYVSNTVTVKAFGYKSGMTSSAITNVWLGKTVLQVTVDVHSGNNVYFRGSDNGGSNPSVGFPISWAAGKMAMWTAGNIWRWVSWEMAQGTVTYKALKNDLNWESDPNHTLTTGTTSGTTFNGGF